MSVDDSSDDLINPVFYERMRKFDVEDSDFNPMIDDDSPVFIDGEVVHDDLYPGFDGVDSDFELEEFSNPLIDEDSPVLDPASGVVPSVSDLSGGGSGGFSASLSSPALDSTGVGSTESDSTGEVSGVADDFNPMIDDDSPVFVPDSSDEGGGFSLSGFDDLGGETVGGVRLDRGEEGPEVESEEISDSVSGPDFNPMIDDDSPIFVPEESAGEAFSGAESDLGSVEESGVVPLSEPLDLPEPSTDLGVDPVGGLDSTVDSSFVNPMIDDDSPVFRDTSKTRPSPLVSDISSPSAAPSLSSPVSEEGGGDGSAVGRDQVRVSRMRSEGVFRAGREVKAGEWNEFDEDVLDFDGLSVGGLTDDAYSGAGVSREFGVPADGLSGGVGERYVERAEFKKDVKPAPRHKGLESDFNHSSSLLVSVDEETGVPLEVQRSFIDRYGERDSERLENVSESFVSSRINKEEIRFFRNLGHSKKGFMDADSLILAGDVDTTAVDEEELERSKRQINRALGGAEALRSEAKFSFTHRDREILAFLAMFKYANAGQLARMFSADPISVRRNLRRMEKSGLVRREKVVNTAALWFLTDAGMLLSGFDLPRTTKGRMNWSMFPHQFTVNYVAANLWGANLNVLNLEDFPSRNRLDIKGEPVFGEELLSELAVQSSFGKFKQGARASVYKPQLLSRMALEFDEWRASGGVEFGESPEFFEGNEWMWVLFETGSELNYHVPDLVVKRGRGEDGAPKSIAVEVELMNKDWDSYMRTLKAYQTDTRVYEKVVWVCKGLGTAEKLEKAAKTIGLWQEGRISITPVLTEDGVFKGDLWTI